MEQTSFNSTKPVSEFHRFCFSCIAEDDLVMLEIACLNMAHAFWILAQVYGQQTDNIWNTPNLFR